jgi:xeroderma pigmentosum group C-complementing protein
LQTLVDWWCHSFFDISDKTLGMRTRPWDEVHEIVDQLPKLTKADFVGSAFSIKGKEKAQMDEEKLEILSRDSGGERLRSINSLMKKALQQEGSRDVSAQLFVSLARACGLGARLVVSLQAVPWRAEKVAPKKKPGAGRGGKTTASRQGNGPPSDEEDSDEMEEVPIPAAEDAEGGPGEVVGKIKSKNKTRQAGRRRHIDPADVYRLRPPRPAAKTAAAAKKKPSKLGELIRAALQRRKRRKLSDRSVRTAARVLGRSVQPL